MINYHNMLDPAREPLKPQEAKKIALEIVENGIVDYSGHAKEEMKNDGLQTTDCINLLRAGLFTTSEYRNGEWRYRVESPRICFIVAFASETRLRVVTAWRFK